MRIYKKNEPGSCKDLSNPKHGDTARSWQFNKKKKVTYYFRICCKCFKGIWLSKEKFDKNKICTKCNNDLFIGNKHHSWKGGIRINKNGYKMQLIYPSDPIYHLFPDVTYVKNGTKSKFILVHRYVYTKFLNRPLKLKEEVHHKVNKNSHVNKLDNRIENLELLDYKSHRAISRLQKLVLQKDKEIEELRKQIKRTHEKEYVVGLPSLE